MPLDRARAGYGTRVAAFYGASFLTIGLHLPFFPVVLAARGLGETEIGIVMAAPLFVRIPVSPLVAYLADRTGSHRRVVQVLSLATCLCLAAFLLVHQFAGVLAVAILLAFFWVTVLPLTDMIALAGVRQLGLDYGGMRLWGSLAFVLANVGGGIAVGQGGAEAALLMMVAAAALAAAVAGAMPGPVAPHERTGERITLADVHALLAARPFLLLLATASLVNGSHALFYIFGSLHWQSLGIAPALIGSLWATGVLAEIALFATAGRLLRGIPPEALLLLSALAAALRWTLMALDPPALLLFPVQALHGLSFGAMHLGTMQLLSRTVPERMAATAQGLYAATTAGIAMGTVMTASGPLYAALGGHGYLVMTGLAGLGILAALALRRSLARVRA